VIAVIREGRGRKRRTCAGAVNDIPGAIADELRAVESIQPVADLVIVAVERDELETAIDGFEGFFVG